MRATIEAASPAPGLRRPGSSRVAGSRAARGAGGGCGVVQRAALPLHVAGHGAVEQAGVEVVEAEVRGNALGQRALARRRRPVDGDDHSRLHEPEVRAPSPLGEEAGVRGPSTKERRGKAPYPPFGTFSPRGEGPPR